MGKFRIKINFQNLERLLKLPEGVKIKRYAPPMDAHFEAPDVLELQVESEKFPANPKGTLIPVASAICFNDPEKKTQIEFNGKTYSD